MITNKTYNRIISLAPSITETLFAIGFGGRMVGRTESCDWPFEAETVPVIGGFKSVTVQTILNHTPDMVIGTSLHKDILANVKSLSVDTTLIPAFAVYDAPSAIRKIGRAIGAESESETIALQIEERIARIKRKALSLTRQRVCYLCDIACPAWYSCPAAASVEFLNCTLAGRKAPQVQNSDDVVKKIIADTPGVFVIPECKKCLKECINPLLNSNSMLTEYISLQKPRKAFIESKLLGRAGPRAAQALDELGRAIFGSSWEMETL
jgi:iron complex transport system substrate-binding protein